MPICDPKQLSAQIRKGELQNLYYIYGADLVQVKQLTASLLKKGTGGNADMALTRFDGQKQHASSPCFLPITASRCMIWTPTVCGKIS